MVAKRKRAGGALTDIAIIGAGTRCVSRCSRQQSRSFSPSTEPMHRATPRKKPLSFLEKAVPARSSKYNEIKARIDTGLTMDKVHVVTTREYLRRRSEIFARVTAKQLQELFQEYDDGELDEEISGTRQAYDGPRVVTHDVDEKPLYDKPYLLLDIRSAHEFASCHIRHARNYPMANLNQDKLTADLLRYRNREGTLIIVYDEDDRLAPSMAKHMIEKGFSNTYVLSGGLHAFLSHCPHYVEGRLGPEADDERILVDREADDTIAPLGLCQAALDRLALSNGGKPSVKSQASQRGMDVRSVAACSAVTKASTRIHGGANCGGNTARTNRGSTGPMSSARSHAASTALALSHAARRRRSSSGDDAASCRSSMSVAESVISRAQLKKGSF